ncbi:MAG: DUF3662 and FHA domain-containing protein [Actinomycetaceae bacterium]|nr:DUF3662 and FHA domain-containing protein [Actinomycetaceae bacterium]
MGAFDKFERGMENAVASVFSRAFHSELKPVEITSAVKKAMDQNASTMTRSRTIGPNDFTVFLAPDDRERMAQWSEDALAEEITASITQYATEQDYTLLGPIRIVFETKEELSTGSLQVDALIKRGAVAPATSAAGASGHPIIEIGQDRYLLTGNVTVIGRGSECDITVDDTGISRRHIELRVTPHGVVVTDLGSTNGSFVEGHRITAATLVDGNTITIGRTHIMFWNSPEPA